MIRHLLIAAVAISLTPALLADARHIEPIDTSLSSIEEPVNLNYVDPPRYLGLDTEFVDHDAPADGHRDTGEGGPFGPFFNPNWPLADSTGYVYNGARPDSHAPIGVMADHAHHKGEVMLSYRYMYMEMKGNRRGDSRVSNSNVLEDFFVTPTKMTMQMHMLGVMYAPTDWVTLMAMLPIVRKKMDHRVRNGVRFTTVGEDIGDLKLGALFPVYVKGRHNVQFNVGLSVPTGSIDEKDMTPLGRAVLPYPMQIGSGTVDAMLGGSYVYQRSNWSWGTQASGVIRMGRNDEDYSLGDTLNVTTWFGWNWSEWISSSVRLNYDLWGNIDGQDDRIARTNPIGIPLVPTAEPDRRGGQRLDLLLGVNLYIRDGFLKGHRFAIEGGMPIWQKLEGPQLETDWIIQVGWQFAF